MRTRTSILGAPSLAGIGASIVFAISVATTLAYGEELQQQVAIEHRGPGGISWDILIPNASAMLVVAGPSGEVFREQFDNSPSFFFIGAEGDPLPDGNYNYELKLVPYIDAGVRDELQAVRESGDETMLQKMMERHHIPTKGLGFSGSFSIRGGNPVTGEGPEAGTDQNPFGATAADPAPIPAPDFMINDDLIVDGSACIGFDCVNGESFGFDTLRLKENNLRIKFQDTSTSASFPSNDWQITANDSSNGGANKFSIDDIDGGTTPFTIEASAPSHSLYVDDSGRVGFGTSTPVAEQHSKDGNTPTLRLEQDGSSGFTAQTWDVAGNEANFFIRDATNGSSFPFRIQPGAPSNSLTIRGDGNVGIGTWDAAAPLHVIGNGGGTLQVERNDGITPNFRFRTTGGGVTQNWLFQNNAQLGVWAIRDETAGNSPFRIYPGGLESTLTLRWGRVGIGTTNPTGKLDVNGSIYQRGGVLHADYVFEPDYKMESIKEHSAFMWKEKHLPAVPRAKKAADGQEVVEIGSERRGILEELEKAHVYIEQLDGRLVELNGRLVEKDDQIAGLQAQLEQLEALVKSMAETHGEMNR